MAVVHCLTIVWRDDTDPGEAAHAVGSLLTALTEDLAGVVAAEHGRSLGLARSADYGAVLVFAGADDFQHYVAHDIHRALVDHLDRLAHHRDHVQFATGPTGTPPEHVLPPRRAHR